MSEFGYTMVEEIEKLPFGVLFVMERARDGEKVPVLAWTSGRRMATAWIPDRPHRRILCPADLWEEGGMTCEAWEPGPTRSLASYRAAGERPGLKAILKLGRDLAEALTYLHLYDLSAGEIVPENVFVGGRMEEGYLLPMARPAGAFPDPVDLRVRRDLRALGVLLFELVVRRRFRPEEDLRHVRQGFPIAALYNPELPPEADAVICRLLDDGALQGYVRAKQVLDDLRQVVAHLEQPVGSAVCTVERGGRTREQELESLEVAMQSWVTQRDQAAAEAASGVCAERAAAPRVSRPPRVYSVAQRDAGRGPGLPVVAAGLVVLVLFKLLAPIARATPGPAAGATLRAARALRPAKAELVRLRVSLEQARARTTSAANAPGRIGFLERLAALPVPELTDDLLDPELCRRLRARLETDPAATCLQIDRLLHRLELRASRLAGRDGVEDGGVQDLAASSSPGRSPGREAPRRPR